jgi:NAD(P)H dehydrogenase (quinone)
MCVTTGANELETGPRGKEGDVRLQLWPTAQTLRYCGYSVCEPVLVHGVHGYHEGAAKAELAGRLAQALQAADRLATGFTSRPLIPFNRDTDFDAEGRLRDGAPGHSPFIRHPD